MKVLEKQGYHLLALAIMIPLTLAAAELLMIYQGQLGAVRTGTWFVVSLSVAILHQVYVLIGWRGELHYGLLSGWLGELAFPAFRTVFVLFLMARLLAMIGLAVANQGSIAWDPQIRLVGALSLAVPAGYVFYSVVHYFGVNRAAGIDHFDRSYRGGELETRGSFGFTANSIYKLGFLALWIPGVAAGSRAALLGALFQHLYIWIHYYTVERPDMRHIYGEAAVP